MSFEVFPGIGSGPLVVAAGSSSAVLTVSDFSAIDPVTGRTSLFVRVVQVRGPDDAGAGVDPVLRLGAGPGPLVAVGSAATPLPAQAGDQAVAIATAVADGQGLYLVEVEVLDPQPQWTIQIGNTDTRAHRYTGVVAGSKAAARRGWLDVVTASAEFRAEINETTVAQEAVISNYGPGPLALADADGTDLGSGFRLVSVSPRPIPANQQAIAAIEFTAPATPGSCTAVHDFASDDYAAGRAAGHNNRVSLSATVRPLDPFAWGAGVVFAQELGQVDAVAMIQSNFAGGNFEVVARVGDCLHHYWSNPVAAPGVWNGTQFPAAGLPGFQIASGVAGAPAFILSRPKGNFEVVVPRSGGGLVHLTRRHEGATAWGVSAVFAVELGQVDAVAMIQTNFGRFEVVARVGDRLHHYWSDPAAARGVWNGTRFPAAGLPGFQIASGVAGAPAFIFSRQKGNYEVVVPRADGGMVHLTRRQEPVTAWGTGLVFAQELGQVDAVAMIQSFLGSGNFEVVARVGDRLHHYWSDPVAARGVWNGTRFPAAGLPGFQIAGGVAGCPALILSRPKSRFEVVVPHTGGGILHRTRVAR